MNDDACKEERERFFEAKSELIMITKREPRMRRGETEIHKPNSKKNIQKLDPDLIEKWKKDVEIAQQKNDEALKEYDECKEKHGISGRVKT